VSVHVEQELGCRSGDLHVGKEMLALISLKNFD
jgi:hypothetical protein